MKAGDTVELTEDTSSYKKGRRAVVICPYDRQNGNKKKATIRFIGEEDIAPDADVFPKSLLRVVSDK